MATYYIGEKPFNTLDDARAHAISVISKSTKTNTVEICVSGAYTWIDIGLVRRIKGVFYWQADGIWVLNKKGKIIKRLA